jgi:hypothetical protein
MDEVDQLLDARFAWRASTATLGRDDQGIQEFRPLPSEGASPVSHFSEPCEVAPNCNAVEN